MDNEIEGINMDKEQIIEEGQSAFVCNEVLPSKTESDLERTIKELMNQILKKVVVIVTRSQGTLFSFSVNLSTIKV